MEAPTEEKAFSPFGPTDEPVDTSGLFESFGGVNGGETDDSFFMVEEEPAQQLGFREHIAGGLTAITRALVMVAILHYLWLSFGNSFHARMVNNTYDNPKSLGASPVRKTGRLSRSVPPRGPQTRCSNDSVNVLVDGVVSIFDMTNPRLEKHNHILPLLSLIHI